MFPFLCRESIPDRQSIKHSVHQTPLAPQVAAADWHFRSVPRPPSRTPVRDALSPVVRWLVGVDVLVVVVSSPFPLPLEPFLLGLRLAPLQYLTLFASSYTRKSNRDLIESLIRQHLRMALPSTLMSRPTTVRID